MEEKKRILVVDDDVMLLKLAESILYDSYEVAMAKSGLQAIRYIKNRGIPNIVLLDVDMPEMDGYETLEQIREIPGGENLPIIYLTGRTGVETEVRCLESGAIDFIGKPFSKDVLLSRIRLRMKQAESNQHQQERHVITADFSAEYREMLEGVLSATELKIARLIAIGYSNREVAEELKYSYNYIKKCSSIILNKLQLEHRGELRRYL
ncbi:MAG: response regulator [Lachnospiraceae bacterium]|nr:response regulator [Lachnospiraceae bacterium]